MPKKQDPDGAKGAEQADVKPPASTAAAIATGVLPTYKDQVQDGVPRGQTGIPVSSNIQSVEGIPVTVVDEEPRTLPAAVIETIDAQSAQLPPRIDAKNTVGEHPGEAAAAATASPRGNADNIAAGAGAFSSPSLSSAAPAFEDRRTEPDNNNNNTDTAELMENSNSNSAIRKHMIWGGVVLLLGVAVAVVVGVIFAADNSSDGESSSKANATDASTAQPVATPPISVTAQPNLPPSTLAPSAPPTMAPSETRTLAPIEPDLGENPCAGKRPQLDNVQCVDADLEEIFTTGEQSPVNVTKGYNGRRNTTHVPITIPYREGGLCPVNVNWHIGAEHYSLGEFDETGTGPIDFQGGRQGFQCKYYDENDPKFTTPFKWEHCIGMTIGQSYEVQWPHSKAGKCNTPWQYQTPFEDGVFCGDIDFVNVAQEIGVQSQTFVVVNDEEYFYPDLFSGMIVNQAEDKGVDLAIYTGSTTGSQRDNNICSPFSPITWHVDRKCHLVSASSFDRMCAEMMTQPDDMRADLSPHGSRELVADIHAANNHQTRR